MEQLFYTKLYGALTGQENYLNLPVVTVLNALGEEGWELVGTSPTADEDHCNLFFKRPKQ
jgi:hypothetical protein